MTASPTSAAATMPAAATAPTVEELAQVVAEPARLRILLELLGGVPLPAGALAARLGLAPSTVSGHLARLADAGLISVRPDGRRRMASLDRPDVADAVEALSRLTVPDPVSSLTGHHRRAALREARSCYDHLAGRLGVAVADLFLSRGWVIDHDGAWTLPATGVRRAATALGVPLTLPTGGRRPAVRPCVDWTERRPHLAGRLGAAVLASALAAGWVGRRPHDRALDLTPSGRVTLDRLGLRTGRGDDPMSRGC